MDWKWTKQARFGILGSVALLALSGTLYYKNIYLPSPSIDRKIEHFESHLRHNVVIAGEEASMHLTDRMNHYNVPAVNIAVMENGKIAWKRAYGTTTFGENGKPIDEKTKFQAGSISKPVTAFGALILVQEGKLDLDEDVNRYLKRWKVPENEFTTHEKVTLRRLLSHTAGTTVDGFPGYSTETTLPTVVQILEGDKTLVNTDPVRVTAVPGSKHAYSGGGTTIVQLLIEDVTGEKFEDWMMDHVLTPLGMSDSTFDQFLDLDQNNMAFAHLSSGEQVKGGRHLYPEMAAAGLWTTPSDLLKFCTYLNKTFKENHGKVLNPSLVHEMLSPQHAGGNKTQSGLGLFLGATDSEGLSFGHSGADEGFIAEMLCMPEIGQGFVVMINSDIKAFPFRSEIIHSLAETYGWSKFRPIKREKINLDPALLSNYQGSFTLDEDSLEINQVSGKLYIDFGLGSWELHPSTDNQFFVQEMNILLKFDSDARRFKIYQDGKEEGIFTKKQPGKNH